MMNLKKTVDPTLTYGMLQLVGAKNAKMRRVPPKT
jgi:hypothetical protein